MEKEEKSQYQYLTFKDIQDSVKRAASQLGGYQTDERDLAFELCHKLGVLYAERNDEGSLTRYTFASRLHQRYDPLSFLISLSLRTISFAYSRLFLQSGPDAPPDDRSLYQVCLAALKKFSPTALQSRHDGPSDQWTIPEAAFQNEMYRCLFKEISGYFIWPKHSHNRTGRVNFLIPDRR